MSLFSRWRTALGAAALTAVSAGCRDASAPPDDVVVTVSVPVTVTHSLIEQPSGPIIACSPEFVAEAEGQGAATWTFATFRWHAGVDRATAFESDEVPVSQVTEAFGATRIEGGETQRARWEFTANGPFEIEATFRYLREGSVSTATTTTRFACGPVPPVGVAGPGVTELALPSLAAEVDFGDTITVTYSATSSFGLWSTKVVVSGAFDAQRVFSERMATSTSRTVTFAVPSSAKTGLPIIITAYAVDAGMQQHSRSMQAQTTIVDRTPPRLTFANVGGLPVKGQYAVGETFQLNVAASDNHALTWLIYALGAPANVRDSMQAPANAASHFFPIHLVVRPEWVGAPVLTLYARDAAGLRSETFTSTPDSLRFYPTVARPTSSAVVLSRIGDVIHDARRGLVYIGQPQTSRIAVLATATMTLDTAIALPSPPAGMDLSAGGDSLIVALPDQQALAVVNLGQRSAVPSIIALPALTAEPSQMWPPRPSGLRVAATGVAVVMLTHATQSGDQTMTVDLRTGVQRIRSDARALSTSGGGWLDRVERTPDRSRVVIIGPQQCSRSYLAATDAFTACAEVPYSPNMGMTFDASGTRLTYGASILDSDLRLIRTASAPIALAPDGSTAYLGRWGGITWMRIADGLFLERIPLSFIADRVLMDPSGDWLLAFQNFGASSVVRIDLR